jgi:hypothetical protein
MRAQESARSWGELRAFFRSKGDQNLSFFTPFLEVIEQIEILRL